MVGLFAAMIAAGSMLFATAAVWHARTRRTRELWRRSRHRAKRVAIVLELEERVRELETAVGSGAGAR